MREASPPYKEGDPLVFIRDNRTYIEKIESGLE